YAPDVRILFFFIIPMKMKTFAMCFFVMESVNVLTNFMNAGGSAGHLGGALCGLFFMKNRKALAWLQRLGGSGRGGRTRRGRVVRDAEIVEERRSPYQESREVDRILDKISSEGFESLTKAEKETLERARKR
ncbi:MAG: DUF6576 domain-containing protein, partial [Verrucomicrobiales bacterium]